MNNQSQTLFDGIKQLTLLLFVALLAVGVVCQPGWGLLEVQQRYERNSDTDVARVCFTSQLGSGEVQVSLLGKGSIRSSKLVPGATVEYSYPHDGIIQYRLSGGQDRLNEVLELRKGFVAYILINGSIAPAASAVTPQQPSLPAASPADGPNWQSLDQLVMSFRNPFGPAFDTLTLAEKISLVRFEGIKAGLSPTERDQLLGLLLNQQAVEIANTGRYSEAEGLLRESLRYLPKAAVVRRNLVMVLSRQGADLRQSGSLPAAQQKLLEALGLCGGFASEDVVEQLHLALAAVFTDQAGLLVDSQEFRRNRLLEQAVSYAEYAPALFELGQSAYSEYDLPTALDYYQRAYAVSPQPELAELIARLERELASAGDFLTQDRGEFRISFEGRASQWQAREVRKILTSARREASRVLGLRPNGTVSVVIYSAGQFQSILGLQEWAGGAYDGKLRLPIGDLSQTDFQRSQERLRQLIFHEYTHALLHSHTSGRSLPGWVQEGLAQQIAGEKPRERTAEQQVLNAVRRGQLPRPSGLSDSFVHVADSKAAQLLYWETWFFVEYLVNSHGGWSRFRRFLADVVDGASVEQAVERNYRSTLPDLEAAWLN